MDIGLHLFQDTKPATIWCCFATPHHIRFFSDFIMRTLEVGLCKGRHEIKNNMGDEVDEFIFEDIENPLDFDVLEGQASDFLHEIHEVREIELLKLYITGLTPALTSFLALAQTWTGKITLMHYNRDTDRYVPQYYQNWM